ncbi:MAG: RNase III inhibitor, partial [Clostridiales bacterium]|nr:RNase III inhibitor [Clostridiales bacterium]
ALDAIRGFLNDHEMMVSLVVFDRESFQLSRERYREVASFIDDNYIQVKTAQQISPRHARRERICRERLEDIEVCASAPMPMAALPKASLADLLAETDAGFSETLLKLIDKTGKKDSEIYTKANLSRQHFSKIRNNPHYQPTKPTAIALALALELNLEQTRDLIGRAGYALTNSSKFDVIIMYFIREKNYNLFDINAALFEFDQSLLGG